MAIKDPIVIRVHQHSEGDLEFDIWLDQDFDELYEVDSDDGGLCTHGNETPEESAKPYSRADYKAALDMAVEQTLDLLFPKKSRK